LLDEHQRLTRASWTAGCRTARPVVWEVGTGNGPHLLDTPEPWRQGQFACTRPDATARPR